MFLPLANVVTLSFLGYLYLGNKQPMGDLYDEMVIGTELCKL